MRGYLLLQEAVLLVQVIANFSSTVHTAPGFLFAGQIPLEYFGFQVVLLFGIIIHELRLLFVDIDFVCLVFPQPGKRMGYFVLDIRSLDPTNVAIEYSH